MNLLHFLQQEKNKILERERIVKKKLRGLPNGKIRVSKNKKQYAYFHCVNDSRGTYICAENKNLIKKLCEKELLEAIEKADEALLKILSVTEKSLIANDITAVISKMHPEKLKVIDTEEITDFGFAEKWSNETYEKLDNNTPLYPTLKGDFARSKSEVIIMNFMYENDIFYRYEQILRFEDGEMFAPDFTLINPHTREIVYWEHFGMMDSPDYVERNMHKITEYQIHGLKLGINFIYTWESSHHPFSISIIKDYLLQNFKAA